MRPLRTLSLLLAALALWIGLRVPYLRAEIERVRQSMRPLAPETSPRPISPSLPSRLAIAPSSAGPPATDPVRTGAPTLRRPLSTIDIKGAVRIDVAPVPHEPDRLPEIRSRSPAAFWAEAGYAAIAAGDRRDGAARLSAAARTDPDDPRAPDWLRAATSLGDRWAVSGWSLLRASGATGPAARPLLGGGQSGVTLSYVPDPLAHRPLALVGRLTAPHRGMGDGVQAALGVRWRLASGLAVDIERLMGLGTAARSAWTARIAGGVRLSEHESLRIDASAYGEAGVIGLNARDLYAAGLAHTGFAAPVAPDADAGAGIGAWGSVQAAAGTTVSRLDVGPTLRMTVRDGDNTIGMALDYRIRIAGRAEPGSGPALTVSTNF